MFQKKFLSTSIKTALGLIVATSMLPAFAADTEDTTNTEGEKKAELMDEVVTTGSRIKRDEFSGPAPVVSFDATEIESGGFVSIQDLLNSISSNTGGSLSQQEVHGFTPAASGVDLRGAGLGRTLTLIDGMRVPHYPKAAGGTDNFFDTANIPLGAVERVEILTSGSSAIYGSDAMGGVINIILKDNFEGVQLSARTASPSEGGRDSSRFSITAGNSSEKASVLLFLEHEQRDRLAATDRKNFDIHTDLAFDHPFSSYSTYGASLRGPNSSTPIKTLSQSECEARGYTYWNYKGGVCGFDRSTMRDLLPEQDRTSAMVKYKYDFAEDLQFTARFDYTRSNVYREIESMAVNDYTFVVDSTAGTVNASSDLSGESAIFDQATAFGGDFVGLSDGEYFYARRMTEFGPRADDITTDNATVIMGLNGTVGDGYDWEASWMFGRQSVSSVGSGYATASGFFNYISGAANGNPNGNSMMDVITPEMVEAAKYSPWEEAEATLSGVNFGITGDLFELPAGAVKFAAGFESYREWFETQADEPSKKIEVLTTGGASGAGKRDWNSVYSEFLIPVVDGLDVTLAARYDDYSDFGSSTTPQIAVEYRPIENLLIRGLWAETFRAPDLQRVYGDISFGFEQITDPLGCTNAGGTIAGSDAISQNIDACQGILYVDANTGPNKDLESETGESWNIGVVYNWQMAGDWNASIDVWGIEMDSIVNELDPQDIANDPVTYANLIIRDANGFIDTVNATAQNLSMRETGGIDLAVQYSLATDNLGVFSAKLSTSHLTKWEEQFDINSEVKDEIEGTDVPEWRSNLNIGWAYNDLTLSMLVNYISKMNGIYTADWDGALDDVTIPSYTTVNLSGSYSLTEDLQVRLGVNNLTDEGPNADPTNWSWPHYPREFYNPVGREVFASFDFKF